MARAFSFRFTHMQQLFAVRRVRIVVPDDAFETGALHLAPRRPVVLFVSEDTSLRVAVSRVLPLEGFDVITARHSGHALLACLSRHIDVLVTETDLIQESGVALARRLKRHQPELRVVYLAPLGDPREEDEDVLPRPFTSEDLVQRLGALLQSSRA